MALKRISDYDTATLPLAGTEMLEVETADGGARKVTAADIAALGASADPTGYPQLDALVDTVTLPAWSVDGGTSGGDPVDAGSPVQIPLSQLIGYILAGGDPSLPWFAAEYDSGATDNAPAVNAAITAAAAAGGGVVFCRRGVWTFSTAPGGASSSQIVLPSIAFSTTAQMTIEIRGECTPSPMMSVIGDMPVSTTGTIFKCTATGSGGKMIGAATPADAYGFSVVLVKLTNITVRMPANTGHTAVDVSNCCGFECDGLVIDAGSYWVQGISEPTTSTSYGLKTPDIANGAYTRIGTLNIIGFYNAMTAGEHTTGEMVGLWGCKRAIEFRNANHASHFDRLMIVHCQRGISVVGNHRFTIDQLDIEHANSGWWQTDYDLYDPSNYAHGTLAWEAVLAAYGPHNSFSVSGGEGVEFARIGQSRSPSVQSVASAATLTPRAKTDVLQATALTGGVTIANPAVAPDDGWGIVIRLKDNGTSRAIAFGSAYRAAPGETIPTATTPGEWTIIGGIWNATDSAFDLFGPAP